MNGTILSSLLYLMVTTINSSASEKMNHLQLNIAPLEASSGCLRIAIFDKESAFLNTEEAVYLKVEPVKGKKLEPIKIGPLSYGEYAVAIFHDINDNGKLDTNLFGVPKEPYAFSNSAGTKWKKPSFTDAKVTLDEPSKELSFVLKFWKDQ